MPKRSYDDPPHRFLSRAGDLQTGNQERKPGGMSSRTDLALTRREAEAVRLRAEGCDYDQIAQCLGYANRSGAYKAVRRSLRRQVGERVEDMRRLEEERLDALQVPLWDRAIDGDGPALDRVLRIIDLRCRLLGLNLPPQIERRSAEPLIVQFGRTDAGAHG